MYYKQTRADFWNCVGSVGEQKNKVQLLRNVCQRQRFFSSSLTEVNQVATSLNVRLELCLLPMPWGLS